MTRPVKLGRNQAKAMGYIQFSQLRQTHTLTAFPNTSRELCAHKTPIPKTVLHDKAHIYKKTQPLVSLHKTEPIDTT